MRALKLLFALFLASVAVGAALGQTTTISGSVTDQDSFLWTNAKVTVTFVVNPNFPQLNQYTLNGQNLATYAPYNQLLNQQAITDPTTGVFTMILLDNTLIQPAGSNWQFNIQSNTSAPATVYLPVQVSGATQNLTSFFTSFAKTPRMPAIPGTYAYGDIELTTVPFPGGMYFNTTNLITRQWNGTVWNNLTNTSIGGVTAINNLTGAFTFTGVGQNCTGGTPNVCNFPNTGSGGGGSFTLNIGEMGALSTGANPTLTHTNHYVMPTLQTTSQINTFLAGIGQAALVFQNGDSVYNSFGNRWWQARITHEGVMFWTWKLNEDDYGIVADGRRISMSFTTGSKTIQIFSDQMRSYDIGKSVWMYNTSTQTTFQSQITAVPDSAHFTITSFPAWSGSGNFYVCTDNTTNFQHLVTDLNQGGGKGPTGPGSGTYLTPAGITLSAGATCLHTIDPQGASLEGAGVISQLVFPAGEDAFATPDAFTNGGELQGPAHLNDFAVIMNGGVDATQPVTKISDGGTVITPAFDRPAYIRTKDSNNPFAPEWCIGNGTNGGGCSLGAATTNGTTTICVTSGGVPSSGQVLFPFVTGGLIETTYVSGAGSCGVGTPITLGASIPAGTNQEFFYGTNFQHTTNDFPASRAYPFSLIVANPLVPTPAAPVDGLAPYGMLQIGAEQCTYYNVNFQVGVNTFNITSCTGTSVDHPANSYITAINPFHPTTPWPVTTTVAGNQTTPTGARFYPGHNIGACAWAFPQSDGSINQALAWSEGHIENIYIAQSDVPSSNNTCAFYFVGLAYATHFNDIRISGTQYGIIQAGPTKNTHAFYNSQPTSDGSTWNGISISTGYIFDFIAANQNNFSNFDTYSDLATPTGSYVGCAGGMFFSYGWDDETNSIASFTSASEGHNLYIEPESGSHCEQEALMEWEGFNNIFTNVHMGGGGFVYIGGSNIKFVSGNFNNVGLGDGGGVPPVVNFGTGNTILYTTLIGTNHRCNIFSAPSFSCGFINWGRDFYGVVPEGGGALGSNALFNPAYGNTRALADGQNNSTFNNGNVGSNFAVNDNMGLITPSEFTNGQFEPFGFTGLWQFDPTATVTQSSVSCNVGNNTNFRYCLPYLFDNGGGIFIGPGQRLAAGKYMVYWSMKSTLPTNTASWGIAVGCAPGTITTIAGPFSNAVTNVYPTSSAGTPQAFVDLTPYANCGLSLAQYGATSADTIYTQFVDFAQLPDNFNVSQLTIQGTGAPTINLGSNGGETWQPGPPSTGCGTTYANGYVWHNLAGTTASTNHVYVCNAPTTTWVNVY